LGWWDVKRLWRRELGKRGSGLDGEEDIVACIVKRCCGYTGGCADSEMRQVQTAGVGALRDAMWLWGNEAGRD